MPVELSVAIQAGGQSRRMGEDKALKSFLGKPLISRVVERARELTDEILVITNEPDSYRFLGLPLAMDLLPGYGALGGLYTALELAPTPLLAVVGCDMPFISPDLLAHQGAVMRTQPGLAAVIPQSPSGHVEMLHAVYRPAACLPAVEASLQARNLRMISWLYAVDVEILPSSAVYAFDPQGLAFRNLNTQQEFLEAEHTAASLVNDPAENTSSSPPNPLSE